MSKRDPLVLLEDIMLAIQKIGRLANSFDLQAGILLSNKVSLF